MGKLVVLKLGDGSFEQGFPVTLQIGEEGRCPCVEITGRLPSIPEIPQCYGVWANTYRRLGLRSRLEASPAQVTNVSKIETCCQAAQLLRERLNAWLASEPFRPLKERLLEQLMPLEEIRIIVQTENIGLRRLPWHLWDLCDRYPKAEIALSAPVYSLVEQVSPPHTKVRILAILGNSTGINTQADRLLLEQLPDAQVSFLVEPQRQELTEEIWKQGWDILFFAGHSSSQENGEIGRIYLNQTDSLTIDQLRFALRKAVERGLKIAIFNSCDGLGLARNLEDLQIPQIIVMREPVPDRVCQEFLKYFLAAFARGESFYLAVREARERLQGLEDDFPCATWLPMICQNLAVLPPSWKALGGGITYEPSIDCRGNYSPPLRVIPLPPKKPKQPRDPWKGRRGLAKVFGVSLGITFLVMGVRHLGILQPLELKAFDFLMQKRPAEPPDSRLLVVTVTEEDIQAQKQDLRPGTSLSDRSLARLLEKLESYQPRAIGLDIYRDFSVAPGYEDLAKRMKQSDRFFSVCKVSTTINDSGISPPPEISLERQGFSDVVIDPDQVLRRHLLYMTPAPASPCLARHALSTQLAFRYLATEKKKIVPQITSDGYIQLGTTVFKRLQARTGGYQNIDSWGHQVMLNYRSHNSIHDFVPQITLTQALNSPLDPKAVKDKIVLIGVTAPSRKDYFLTPYSTYQKIPGVFAHAQMVSQVLSAVLNRRPLLCVWPGWGEALWIWGWSLAGGLIFWRFQLLLRLGLVVGTLFILYSLCFGLLIQGGWVPLIPSALALVLTGGSVVAYKTFQTHRQPKQPHLNVETQSNQYLQS